MEEPALHQLGMLKLTLAKGDEVVDIAEEGADEALLNLTGNTNYGRVNRLLRKTG